MSDSVYCPFCCRNIEPECDEFGDEIEMPECDEFGDEIEMPEGGRLYVHDDVPHDPDYQFEELQ